jgi:hypothetical protein
MTEEPTLQRGALPPAAVSAPRNANDERTPHVVRAFAVAAMLIGAIVMLQRPALGLALLAAGAFGWCLRRDLPRPALRRVRTPAPARWHTHAREEAVIVGTAFHQVELAWLRKNAGSSGVIAVFVPLPPNGVEHEGVRVDSHGVTLGQLEPVAARRYRARYGSEPTAARITLIGVDPIEVRVD